MGKKSSSRKKSKTESTVASDQNICFVISPIGERGTEKYTEFKEALEYVIENAVKASGYNLQVIRADDINRAGSFIKDILENLYSSFVVIADLTEKNPNVFYELGVRHSLSPRTILIAQKIDDIPSDLREYRTILYDTSAKGAAEFSKQLKKYLTEIHKEPERPDNPVLDRLGSIIENRIELLKKENQELKGQLTTILKKGVPKQDVKKAAVSIHKRVDRILKLMNAEHRLLSGAFMEDDELSYELPTRQGIFELYFIMEDEYIIEKWYLAEHSDEFDYGEDLADVRVLMENCIQQGGASCKFIIATRIDLSNERKQILSMFSKINLKLPPKYRKHFDFTLWDKSGLLSVEKKMGLKI